MLRKMRRRPRMRHAMDKVVAGHVVARIEAVEVEPQVFELFCAVRFERLQRLVLGAARALLLEDLARTTR